MSKYIKNEFSTSVRLIWMLSKRDLYNRYSSSYAGIFWNIGVPLFNALVMAVIFSVLMRGRIEGEYNDIPFVLFYFVPFSLWIIFADVVARSTGVLREYSYLINKIAFPFWLLPLVPFASAFISQVIIFLIVIVLSYYFDVSFASTCYMYIILWVCTVILTIGVAYMVSAISVYIPDINQIVPIFINVLFWMTPILYPSSLFENYAPEWLKVVVIYLNPFYHISEYSRYAMLSGVDIPIFNLLFLLIAAVLVLLIGGVLFYKLRSGFSDVL